jgi:hypothetical protein
VTPITEIQTWKYFGNYTDFHCVQQRTTMATAERCSLLISTHLVEVEYSIMQMSIIWRVGVEEPTLRIVVSTG